jgi:hypothetical protein
MFRSPRVECAESKIRCMFKVSWVYCDYHKCSFSIELRVCSRTRDARWQTAWLRSCIHVIVLSIFLVRRRCRCSLLDQLFSVKGAGRVELEPGGDAFEVEEVVLVAGQLDNKRVRVWRTRSVKCDKDAYSSAVQLTFKERVAADRTILVLQARLGDSVQLSEKLV